MVFCYYRKIIKVLVIALLLQALLPATIFASDILWPGIVNLYNENLTLDGMIPEKATSSGSKKGFLFTGDAKEIFTLGAGHIAVNVTLSGAGHTFIQYLKDLKARGIKITVILLNDRAPVGTDIKNIPAELGKPVLYMIDFNATNGTWQKYNFERVVRDYGDIADNWIIGNEINCQTYNFYGPSDVREYTKVYCDTFLQCYNTIKNKNENADVYISFDQGWDLPNLRINNTKDKSDIRKYRYNTKDMIALINQNLDKSIDWGVALHPYPAPVESAIFWDDPYAGFDPDAKDDNNRPYFVTLKNFEVAIEYLKSNSFLKKDKSVRNIIISEFGITSNDGERLQAAALYYLWQKIEDNDLVKCLLYFSLNDLDDYRFGLISKKNRKRIIWALFKDMDRPDENEWCKDLLDEVLEENGIVELDGYFFNIASVSDILKNNE